MALTPRAAQGLVEFIIEEHGGKREQEACEKSAPVEFVLTPDEEARWGLLPRRAPADGWYDATPCAQNGALGNNALRICGRVDHGTVAIQRPVSGFVKVRCAGCTRPRTSRRT